MIKYGKIQLYDNYVGTIVDSDGVKYIFTKKDLNDLSITVGDMVSFKAEVYETIEVTEYIARSIKRLINKKKESN